MISRRAKRRLLRVKSRVAPLPLGDPVEGAGEDVDLARQRHPHDQLLGLVDEVGETDLVAGEAGVELVEGLAARRASTKRPVAAWANS